MRFSSDRRCFSRTDSLERSSARCCASTAAWTRCAVSSRRRLFSRARSSRWRSIISCRRMSFSSISCFFLSARRTISSAAASATLFCSSVRAIRSLSLCSASCFRRPSASSSTRARARVRANSSSASSLRSPSARLSSSWARVSRSFFSFSHSAAFLRRSFSTSISLARAAAAFSSLISTIFLFRNSDRRVSMTSSRCCRFSMSIWRIESAIPCSSLSVLGTNPDCARPTRRGERGGCSWRVMCSCSFFTVERRSLRRVSKWLKRSSATSSEAFSRNVS
mmetsp:Transcript_34376/g.80356  ORF Transcript_34376/g.80356 Transcript_34376/m.80356 type:complete len:279 (+) Transcript_34376:822-1658(+)